MGNVPCCTTKQCLVVFLATIAVSLHAQVPVQNFDVKPRAYTGRESFWTEFNLNGSITKDRRWQYQLDYQYRRGSDATFVVGGNKNPFKEMQQQVIRPWIHYWLVPGTIRLSLSPLGYWTTWTPESESLFFPTKDGVSNGQTVYPEFRITPQVSLIQNVGRVQFTQRIRYEFRFIGERRLADDNLSDMGKGLNFAPTDVGDQSAAKG